MPAQHIVVDGSNIATEGRSAPSLAQLEGAVAELKKEHPDAEVTVIVDATFSHRIDQSELDHFERAVLAGEYVHPPAGAIGRGDAFLLRVAEKVDGTVLSNDSFQEFHGEHPWLFERGRLLGATPVPGIGWIFSPRTPVRGPTSRKAVRDTEKAKRQVTKAIKVATKEAVAPAVPGPRPKIGDRRVLRRVSEVGPLRTGPPAPVTATVNDPLTFVSFIAENPLGAEIIGRVENYTSHGAVVMVGNTQCYVPLANLGHPAPRSAREVLKRGDDVTFVVRALDPQRRGVELALPGVADVSGKPSAEMIQAEMQLARKRLSAATKDTPTKAPARKRMTPPAKAAPAAAAPANAAPAAPEEAPTARQATTPVTDIAVAEPDTARARINPRRKAARKLPATKPSAARPTTTSRAPKAAAKAAAPPAKTAPAPAAAKTAVGVAPAKTAVGVAPATTTGPRPPAKTAGATPPAKTAPPAKRAEVAKASKALALAKAPAPSKAPRKASKAPEVAKPSPPAKASGSGRAPGSGKAAPGSGRAASGTGKAPVPAPAKGSAPAKAPAPAKGSASAKAAPQKAVPTKIRTVR
jgi:hypothetical protein